MYKKLFIALFIALIISIPAQARIYILIDELGMVAAERKFPIAVPSFVSPKGKKKGGVYKKMITLLHKDLKIADLFQVFDEKALPKKDTDSTEIDFKKWRALEVKALVKGVVEKVPGGKSKLQIRLYDVAEGEMIMGKQYMVNSKNYIEATHRIMDNILLGLTGVRGPFHSKIAASCGKPFRRKILSYRMDSTNSGNLVKKGINDISPAWSPNGRQIAYTSFSSRYPEVYISGKQITEFFSTTITPTWTPNGTNLVIASAKSGNTELYVVNQSGNIIRQITKEPNIDFNPSVSPNGKVVFSSERAGGLQLFVTSLNGGAASQLTYTGYQNDQPDWSPDGKKIAFSGKNRGNFDIFVMDANGSNIRRLTRGEGSNESPTWAPDSRYLAFHSSRGKKLSGIYVMLEEGVTQTKVKKSGLCQNLDWGPWLSSK